MAFSQSDVDWLSGLVRGFYSSSPPAFVDSIAEREFGYGVFGSKISGRHRAFASTDAFHRFLLTQLPFYVSMSVARYSKPDAQPMPAKKMTGADLVFEFDADEIPTGCKFVHDRFECPSCGASGAGRLKKCPNCASGTKTEEWFCPECIGATKAQTIKLLDVLENDLGFSDEVSVHFSGNAGYHVYVRSPAVRSLPAAARIELLDYLQCENVDMARLGFSLSASAARAPALASATGMAKRLLLRALYLAETMEADALAARTNAPLPKVKAWKANVPAVQLGFRSGTLFPLSGRGTGAFYEALFALAREAERLVVDRQTTGDIHKIVRVPDTLHGSTMLVAATIPRERLEAFDPFSDALALSVEGKQRVFIFHAPAFSLGGQSFGPFDREWAELPLAAAALLVARRSASLSDG